MKKGGGRRRMLSHIQAQLHDQVTYSPLRCYCLPKAFLGLGALRNGNRS